MLPTVVEVAVLRPSGAALLEVFLTTNSDAAAIISLRHAAESWLATRGIEQWKPGGVPESVFQQQVDAGEFFVARVGGRPEIVGTLRLVWSDPVIWRERNTFAGYVHSLVISRAHAGTGLGRALLEWAAHAARRQGATLLRLDCLDTNTALRDYYRRAGFDQVCRRDFGAGVPSVALFRTQTDHRIGVRLEQLDLIESDGQAVAALS